MKVDGSVATINIKNFPIGLHVMYLYFPGTPRTYRLQNVHSDICLTVSIHVEKCGFLFFTANLI
jgi:hypothetical protein